LVFGKQEVDASATTISFTEEVIDDVITIHAAWLTGYVSESTLAI
jgi:hypothetical protein